MVHLRPEDSSAKRAEAGNGSELAALNEEWRQRILYSRSPEGIAAKKRWQAFLAMGMGMMKSGEPMTLVFRHDEESAND